MEYIKRIKLSAPILIPSMIFALNILIGISFSTYGDFTYLFGGGWQIAKTILLLVIYSTLFYVILYKLFQRSGNISCSNGTKLSSKIIFWGSFCVLILCYVPYLYAHYPGSINSDSTHQLASYFGYIENTNHYPAFSTWLIGICMQFGTWISSNNLGVFFYILLQTAVLALAFANTLRVIVKWRLPAWLVTGTGIYYAVFPIWGGYAQFMIKDTVYSAVVVWFTTLFLEFLLEEKVGHVNNRKIWWLIMAGIFTILLRNNGVYIVLPCLFAAVFCTQKGRRRNYVWAAFGVCTMFFWLWGNLFLPAMHIPEGSVKEALSVPFQQTARYIKEYEEEVTEEEKAAINAVLAYDHIGRNYVDFGADPVKNTYKEPATSDLVNYFKHWFLMFFKHPSVYFEATVANSYYYYCANINGSFEPIYLNYIYYDENAEPFELAQKEEREALRQEIYEYVKGFQDLPIIGLLFSQGFYTYLLIGMLGFLCYWKKSKYIVGLLPSMISVLVCIASPVNGSYRYFLPVIACTCICIAFCFKCKDV